MPTNFRPGVLPDSEPRRDEGAALQRAFSEFIRDREAISAGERAEARHDIDVDRQRFDFERDLEDEGFERAGPERPAPQQFDRTGRGARSPAGPADRDLFEGRLPGRPGGVDRSRLPAHQEGGMAGPVSGEFDRFRNAGPDAMREPLVLPGQFNPADASFARHAVYMPERAPAPAAAPEPGRRESFMGEDFVRNPERTPEARQAQAFQDEVDRLIQAGVDPELAPAVAEHDLAGSFIGPEEEAPMQFTEAELRGAGVPEGSIPAAMRDPQLARRLMEEAGGGMIEGGDERMEFTREELLAAGVAPGAVEAAMRDPDLARDLIQERHRRFAPRGGAGGDADEFDVADFDRAMEMVNNEYGEFNEEGFLIGHRLSREQRFELAEAIRSGQLRPEDLPPADEIPEEVPEDEEEEGGSIWSWIAGLFDGERGEDPAAAQEPPSGGQPSGEGAAPQVDPARVDSARAAIQEEMPNASPDMLRRILGETGYTPGEIELILGSGGGG